MSMTLPARDWFELYNRRASQLSGLRIVQQGWKWQVHLGSSAEVAEQNIEESGLDEQELRSFLLLFRQFIKPGEVLYIPAILNECWRRATADDI